MIGKWLIRAGIILIVIGWLISNTRIGKIFSKLGHLPGDIVIKKENFAFYFPITTCIILSLVLTLVLWLIFRR